LPVPNKTPESPTTGTLKEYLARLERERKEAQAANLAAGGSVPRPTQRSGTIAGGRCANNRLSPRSLNSFWQCEHVM
jgi:hypothetical protein